MQKLKRFGIGALAATGTAALVLGLAGTPAMAAGTFDTTTPTVTGKSSITLPKSSSRELDFTVTFQGPAVTNDLYYRYYDASSNGATVKLVKRNKKIKSTYVFPLSKYAYPATSEAPTPGVARAFQTGNLYSYTTPGRYRLTVPVTQNIWNNTTYKYDKVYKTGSKEFTVNANKSYSKANSGVQSNTAKFGKPLKLEAIAPYYQAGAKVTFYVKPKGKKKYKKVGTKTLKNYSLSSSKTAKFKLAGKYNKSGTKVKIKVSKVSYSGGYTTSPQKIKKIY